MTATVGVADLDTRATVPQSVAELYRAEHVRVYTFGRRTGRPHLTKVCFVGEGPSLHVLAFRRDNGLPADWYCNVVAAGSTTVELDGVVLRASVVVPTDTEAAQARATALLAEKYGAAAVLQWHSASDALPLRLDLVGICCGTTGPSRP